jgi:sterol desaturase/sphingolipid hydroxylase (fatty acid hydroxylase superfamily)
MDDEHLDILLGEALAPPERPTDRGFVLRVERSVAEEQRYRKWRAALLRQLATEALALAAVGGSFAFIARVPAVEAMLTVAPGLIWAALVLLLLLWGLMRGRGNVLA